MAVNYPYSCGGGPLLMLLWRRSSTLALMKRAISLPLVVAVHYCCSWGGGTLLLLKWRRSSIIALLEVPHYSCSCGSGPSVLLLLSGSFTFALLEVVHLSCSYGGDPALLLLWRWFITLSLVEAVCKSCSWEAVDKPQSSGVGSLHLLMWIWSMERYLPEWCNPSPKGWVGQPYSISLRVVNFLILDLFFQRVFPIRSSY